jgi:hypothetical protein
MAACSGTLAGRGCLILDVTRVARREYTTMRHAVLAAAALVACLGPADAQSVPEGASKFARALEERAKGIRPTPEESRWQRIPWARSVVDGHKAAVAEKRPIMYWNVDDDPLERC